MPKFSLYGLCAAGNVVAATRKIDSKRRMGETHRKHGKRRMDTFIVSTSTLAALMM